MDMMRLYINLMVAVGLLFIFACAGTDNTNSGNDPDGKLVTPQNLSDVAGIEWHLTQLTKGNEPIALVKDSQTTLTCDENGRVTGKATINRYSGNLKLQFRRKLGNRLRRRNKELGRQSHHN